MELGGDVSECQVATKEKGQEQEQEQEQEQKQEQEQEQEQANESQAMLPPTKAVCDEEQETEVKFDDILADLGDFGRHQKISYFLLFLPTIFSAMQKQSWVFLGAKAPHRCRLPGELANSSYFSPTYNSSYFSPTYSSPETNLSLLIPWDETEGRLEQCSMYNSWHNATVPCSEGWIFDTSTFGSSAVMDWTLVCQYKGMRATAQALFMAGVMFGSYTFGWLSDKFGRKPSFFIAVVIQACVGLLSGLIHNYWAFVLLRMVIGATTSGVFLVAYVLAMEMVGPKYRVVAGTLCQYYYTAGFLLMALVAYLLNSDWQLLQICLTLPCFLFLSYWWVVPESVRWQIAQGDYSSARAQISQVARRNRVVLQEGRLERMIATVVREKEEAKGQPVPGVLDLFRHRSLCLKTLALCFLWMVNSGTYYGLALSASNLGGNPYYNYLISAAVEIPAYGFNLLVLDRLGRKKTLAGCMLFAGLVLTVTIFIPAHQTAWLVSLSMLGKLAITSSYGTVYIFTAELFPTVIRNVGMGTTSLCARIGGIMCPYINMLSDTWTPLPLIIYGVLAFTGGLLALFLPETLGRKLPETIGDTGEDGQEQEVRKEANDEVRQEANKVARQEDKKPAS